MARYLLSQTILVTRVLYKGWVSGVQFLDRGKLQYFISLHISLCNYISAIKMQNMAGTEVEVIYP